MILPRRRRGSCKNPAVSASEKPARNRRRVCDDVIAFLPVEASPVNGLVKRPLTPGELIWLELALPKGGQDLLSSILRFVISACPTLRECGSESSWVSAAPTPLQRVTPTVLAQRSDQISLECDAEHRGQHERRDGECDVPRLTPEPTAHYKRRLRL